MNQKQAHLQQSDVKLYEDALLFASFLNTVHTAERRRRNSDTDITIKKKKFPKIRFKSCNIEIDSWMVNNRNNLPIEASNKGYVCTFCDARYVYKRCLVNHLMRMHYNKLS